MDELLRGLAPDRVALAAEIASIPEFIRGYGPVKERHLGPARKREAELLEKWRNPSAVEKRIPIAVA